VGRALSRPPPGSEKSRSEQSFFFVEFADNPPQLFNGKRIGNLFELPGTRNFFDQNGIGSLHDRVAKLAGSMASAETNKQVALAHIGALTLNGTEYF